jgi:hypothetical protein
MSIWTELRDGVRQAILMQERVERLISDVDKINDRLFAYDRRLTRIETLIEMAHTRLPR